MNYQQLLVTCHQVDGSEIEVLACSVCTAQLVEWSKTPCMVAVCMIGYACPQTRQRCSASQQRASGVCGTSGPASCRNCRLHFRPSQVLDQRWMCICLTPGCELEVGLGVFPHSDDSGAGTHTLLERPSQWVICQHQTATAGTPCSICISTCYLAGNDTLQDTVMQNCKKFQSPQY